MKKNDLLDNRYQILEKLGEGGMGAVYKAYDQELEKEVAIKVLKTEALSDDKATTQFKKEVRLSQELRHDNIAATFDFKRSKEFPYLVMEYVEGQILTNHIYNQPNHRLDEDAFSELTNQILDGVEHAHKKGIIHRDLKSSNIMITEDGQIKIMDFGIAASLKETYSRSTGRPITISIHFASPEQINGDPPSESMDIYSLGCVLYEMLNGDPPFTQGDILHQQLTKKPEPIKHISPHLNSVILKCLEKRKEDRFQSVEELRLAIGGTDFSVTVKIPKVMKKFEQEQKAKRKKYLIRASLCVVALLIIIGIFGQLNNSSSWIVISALWDKEEAEMEAARIRSHNYPAIVFKDPKSKSEYYEIKVGPYLTYKDAVSKMAEIEKIRGAWGSYGPEKMR